MPLTKVKDTLPLGKRLRVVYQIPYSCGQVYIGETIRQLETRMKEHQDACERGTLEKSAVAEHALERHHPIKWEDTAILDQARGHKELRLRPDQINLLLLRLYLQKMDRMTKNKNKNIQVR